MIKGSVMKNEAAFLFAESGKVDAWDEEEKASYDAAALDSEFRERLFSEKGLQLLDSIEEDSAPAVCRYR